MCLRKAWVLCSPFCGGLSKGRKVGLAQCCKLANTDGLERQANIDYSICQALAYRTAPIGSALIVYDVACQWSVNFHRRIQNNPFLTLGPISDLIPVVGKFHLAAHVPGCFAKFSLNFVEGAGQLDGEILETLWAEFNKVSTSARSMSKAHRSEVLDDHMRDSNWKKLVGMGKQ